jgi:hypothetical protein
LLCLLAVAVAMTADQKPTITITPSPPESIPAGSCSESMDGFLGAGKGKKLNEAKLSDKQLGEYVRIRLSQGYSLTLYPQASGRIYAVATCHAR